MGDVATWEVVISAIILYISVIGMGVLGGKIFRNSTLRYGNPIKLSGAVKELRHKNKLGKMTKNKWMIGAFNIKMQKLYSTSLH